MKIDAQDRKQLGEPTRHQMVGDLECFDWDVEGGVICLTIFRDGSPLRLGDQPVKRGSQSWEFVPVV